MATIRKKYGPQDKARIALEALKGELTISQITAKYGAHGTQISGWKKQAQSGLVDIFAGAKDRRGQDQSELIDELYKQIGQLKVECDWLKKKSELYGS